MQGSTRGCQAVIQRIENARLTKISPAQGTSRPSVAGEDWTQLTSLASGPVSEPDTTELSSLRFLAEAPVEYHAREADWFRPGRYFKIWARDGENVEFELHGKEFVLLDTKNLDGPALLVRRHATERFDAQRGSFNRTDVALKDFQSSPLSLSSQLSPSPPAQSRRKVVYMDEDEDDISAYTYIELEHTYNIPFMKYKCIDYGVLAPSSLRDLRRFYVEWLQYHWQIG